MEQFENLLEGAWLIARIGIQPNNINRSGSRPPLIEMIIPCIRRPEHLDHRVVIDCAGERIPSVDKLAGGTSVCVRKIGYSTEGSWSLSISGVPVHFVRKPQPHEHSLICKLSILVAIQAWRCSTLERSITARSRPLERIGRNRLVRNFAKPVAIWSHRADENSSCGTRGIMAATKTACEDRMSWKRTCSVSWESSNSCAGWLEHKHRMCLLVGRQPSH